jgi:hypothetical protein
MRGKLMSKDKNSMFKLIMSIGLVGLAMCFYTPRVNAQDTQDGPKAVVAGEFTNAFYSGRYICNVSTNFASSTGTTNGTEFYTAVIKYNPNGGGGYSGVGTLNASDAAFTGGSGTAFCSYTLDPTSAYAITSNGTGFEKLVWDASSSNETVCPASFTDLRAIALRNLLNNNGIVIDSEVSSTNLLGEATAGRGYCLK